MSNPSNVTIIAKEYVIDGGSKGTTIISATAHANDDAVGAFSCTISDLSDYYGKTLTVTPRLTLVGCSEQYVTGNPITITVPKKAITLTAASANKIYDGTALTRKSASTTNLAEGHVLDSYNVVGSQTDAGISANEVNDVVIKDASGEDVTAKYEITYVPGVLNVLPKEVTVKASNDSKVYGQNDPAQFNTTISGRVPENALSYTVSRAAGENVGTYEITPSGEELQGNYAVIYQPGTFTITPAAATITVNSATKVYGDEDPSLSATVEGLVGSDVLNYTLSREQGENVGEYVITVTLGDNPNYNVTVVDGIFTITKDTAIVTITGANNNKIYNGSEQQVIGYSVSIPQGVSLSENEILGPASAVAFGTDAGTYNMGLRAEDFSTTNNNYYPVFAVEDGTLIIHPMPITVLIMGAMDMVYYDGTAHSATGYTASASSTLYDVDSDISLSGTAVATRTDVGTTHMGLSSSLFTNTNDNFEVSFSVVDGYETIIAINATVNIIGHHNTTVYDGNAHVVEGFDVQSNTSLYTAEDIIFTGNASASRTEVGTTNMGLTTSQFANNNSNFAQVIFYVTDGFQEINPVEDVVVTITGHQNISVYDGEEHVVEGYDVEISNPLYTTSDFSFTGSASASLTEVGTATMGLASSQFTNHNSNFTNVIFNVTDGYQQINPVEDVVVTITGHHNVSVYDGQEHTVEAYDVEISNPLYTTSDFSFSGSASASRTYVGTTTMGLASNQFVNNNDNFANVVFNVTDGYQQITPVEGVVVTITGHHNVSEYDRQEHGVEGYDVEINNPLYTTSDFSFSGSFSASRTDVGTSNMGLASSQFTNNNSNFAQVTFDVTDGYQQITAVEGVVVTITGHHNVSEYDRQEHGVEGYDVDINNPLYTTSDFSFSGNASANRTEAGTTTMGLASSLFTNTNTNFANVSFNVTDGYQQITVVDGVVVTITGHQNVSEYNGQEYAVEGYDVEISNPLYTLSDFSFSGNASASRTVVGTSNMGLASSQFTSTNNNFIHVTFNVTDGYQRITAVEGVVVNITGHHNASEYNGQEHAVEGYDVEISNPLYTTSDFSFSSNASASRTNVGTSNMGLASSQFTNNNNNFAHVSFNVTDGYQQITAVDGVVVTITGHHSINEYDRQEHAVEGYDVEISNPLYTTSDYSFSGNASASRTDVGTSNMGLATNQFANTNTNFTNVSFNVTDGYQQITSVDGVVVTITGHQNAREYDRQEHAVEGYDVEISNPLYTTSDFSFSGNASASRTNIGTSNMGLATNQFANTNNNFTHVTFNVTDGYQQITAVDGVVVTITGHHSVGEYDRQEHSVEGYDVEISNPLYTTSDFSFSGNASASRTDVGTSNMGLATNQFTNINTNFTHVTFNVTDGYQQLTAIDGVVVTITGHHDASEYDGQEHSVEGYNVEFSNPLYTTSDFSFSGNASASRTSVGTTNMGLATNQFANTNTNFTNVSFNVTDGYQQITAVGEVIVTITGHHNVSDYNGQQHAVEGYDVEISNPLYTISDFIFSGNASASRTNVGTTNMGLAANQFTNTSTNFTHVTFDVTDGYQQINAVEGVVVTITGHHNVSDYNGQAHEVEGYDVEISNPLYTVSDFTFSGNVTATRTNAGTSNMGLATNQFANTNTNFSNVSFNVTDGFQTINKINATVTITGHHNSTVYDGNAHVTEGYDVQISTNLYSEDDFIFSGNASASRTDVGTTNMGLTSSQFTNNNDNFAVVSFNVTDGYQTITKASVTVTITGVSGSVVYNGSEQQVNGYSVSIPAGVTLTESQIIGPANAVASGMHVGTYHMGLTADAFSVNNDNYNVSFELTDGVLTINRATATVTAEAKTKVYGAADPALTAVVSGLQGGDAANMIQYTISRAAGENVGTYTITPSGAATQGDYNVTYVPASLTITKATATVTAQVKTKVYGAADPALTAVVSGLQNGDATNVIQYTVSRTAGENVGTYTITPSGATTQGNYNVTYVPATMTITKATVTVTAQAKTKVYGATDPTLTATVSGLKNGDAASVIQYTVTRTAGENVGTYTITPSGAATQGNYDVTYVPAIMSITRATATVTAQAKTKVYGATDPALTATVSGLQNGDAASVIQYTVSRTAGENVGTYTITPSGATTQGNYNVTYVNASMTITKATATVTADAKTKVYGAADPALTAVVSGLQNGDAAGVIQYTVGRTAGENVGTYTITPSGAASQGNYNVTYVTANMTITRASATVTAQAKTKVYGAADPALTVVVSSLQNGDAASVIQYTVSRTAGENVGTYTITPSGATTQGNYNVTYVNASMTITKAMATVTADAKTKVYGATDPVLTAVVSGLQNGDAASVIQYTVSRTAGENAGTYTITPSGAATQGNYDVTYVPANMTITRATATVTADAKTKVYGAADPALTAVVSGLQNGDAVSVIQYTVSRTAGENVGTYTITPSGATTQGNYNVVYVTASMTITKASATVTAQSKTKVYGATDPTLTAVVSGLKNGDAANVIQYTVSRTAGENVGTYTITPSGAASQGNYDVTYVNASMTITRATATVTAQSKTKVYGTADPTLTAVVSGLKNGDAASVIQYTLTRTVGEDAGTYTITASGNATQGNYNVTYVNAVFTITKASITVTVTGNTSTTTYNGTAQSVSGYNLDIPAGATLIASEITGPASAVATGTDAGTYPMGLSAGQFSANNNNYNVSFALTDGALTIARAVAVVQANDASKYYGEADPPLTATVTGLFGSDALTYSVRRASGDRVGTYTIVSSGAATQGNYTVTYRNGTFTIMMHECPTMGATTYTPNPLEPTTTSMVVSTVLDDFISSSLISRAYYRVSVSGGSSSTISATCQNGSLVATIPIQPAYRGSMITVTPYITTVNCTTAGANQAGDPIEICVPLTTPVTLATAVPYPANGLNKTQLFTNEGITLKAKVENYSNFEVASYGFLISDNPDDIQTYNSEFSLPASFTNVDDTLYTHKIGLEYCKKTWYYRPYMILRTCNGGVLYGEISSVTMWGPEDYNPTATPLTVTAGDTVTLSSTAYITVSSYEGWKPIEYYLDPNGQYASQFPAGISYENWTYYWKANGSQIYSSHTSGNTTHHPTQTTVYDAYCVFEINGVHCIVNGNPITVTVTQP